MVSAKETVDLHLLKYWSSCCLHSERVISVIGRACFRRASDEDGEFIVVFIVSELSVSLAEHVFGVHQMKFGNS